MNVSYLGCVFRRNIFFQALGQRFRAPLSPGQKTRRHLSNAEVETARYLLG
jgi:hypothetical protein